MVDRYFPYPWAFPQTELESIEERIFVRGATRVNIQRRTRSSAQVMGLKHAVSPLVQFAGS